MSFDRFANWVAVWGGLIDCLVSILTLTYKHPNLEMAVLAWKMRVEMRAEGEVPAYTRAVNRPKYTGPMPRYWSMARKIYREDRLRKKE